MRPSLLVEAGPPTTDSIRILRGEHELSGDVVEVVSVEPVKHEDVIVRFTTLYVEDSKANIYSEIPRDAGVDHPVLRSESLLTLPLAMDALTRGRRPRYASRGFLEPRAGTRHP
jgi:hypothetical protein